MEGLNISGVILREVKYRESDAIITILSAEKGIITASVKGIYKMTSKNRAAIQLFCYSDFELSQGKGGYIVKSATVKSLFYGIRMDPEMYALACYISELAGAMCTSENDETEALRLTLNAFAALDESGCKPLWQIKAAYEFKLCCICGFTPLLDVCGICGCSEDDASEENGFTAKGKYLFSLKDGAVICNECFNAQLKKGESILSVKLSEGCLCAAKYLSVCPIERFLSFKLAKENGAEFEDFTEKYLHFIAERGFASLKYYKALISGKGV